MSQATNFERWLERKLADPEWRAGYEGARQELDLALAIVRARIDAGLTQEQLAERMGVSQATVANLERPGKGHSTTSLARFARALDKRCVIMFVPSEERLDDLEKAGIEAAVL
jgi:transcriptional regulator with XRE-family HTH domain